LKSSRISCWSFIYLWIC